MTHDTQRPLPGIRVIGLEQYIAGPYCTMLLADPGAEVIKIERPDTGDPRRAIPPFAEKRGARKVLGYLAYNRNKKSLALDIQKAEGRAILLHLAESPDVVVEDLRPGALAKIDLGFEALRTINPRLIYVMVSGFGRLPGYETRYAHRPAFDIVAEAMAGVMDLVGFEDRPPTFTLYGMADGYVALNVRDDRIWAHLATAMERPDLITDRRCATGDARAANEAFLRPMLEAWMAHKTRSEVVHALDSRGMPAGPVYSAKDVFADPHFQVRGMLPIINDPEVGPYAFARTTPHLSATPEIPLNPAPALGAHTREILGGLLGYSASRIDALADAGVIGI